MTDINPQSFAPITVNPQDQAPVIQHIAPPPTTRDIVQQIQRSRVVDAPQRVADALVGQCLTQLVFKRSKEQRAMIDAENRELLRRGKPIPNLGVLRDKGLKNKAIVNFNKGLTTV